MRMTGALPCRLRFDGPDPLLEWVRWDGSRFTEPFFEETVARLRGAYPSDHDNPRPRTSLAALREIPAGLPLAGLVFHISRCGSTLVSRMLASSRRNVVVSEAPIFDELLRLRDRLPRLAADEHLALLRGAARALGPPPADGGAERLFIKLDCWHIFSLELLRQAFPGVPLLFIHRHPLEVLVSLMHQPSLALVPGTVTPTQLGLSVAERDALSREEHAAAIIGAFFRAATAARQHLVPLAYEALPGGLTAALPESFFTGDERRDFLSAAAFHSKRPSESFQADGEKKRGGASPVLRAACARYAELEYVKWLSAENRVA